MQSNKQGKQGFFKRNLYYFIIAFILLAAVSVTVGLLVTGDPVIDTAGKKDSGKVDGGSSDDSKLPEKPDSPEKPDDPIVKPEPLKFIMPVSGGKITQEYTAASVVYNQTLGVYTGHLALDISADGEADVLCAADGEVESVTTAYLTGTTVRVKHSDGVVTVYNSIDVNEDIVVGKQLKCGDVIGKISDNNKQEYKDGAHLHFEAYENDVKIDPRKYMDYDEK